MDHSPVTPVTPESPPIPQRMSTLYQYHNAPEVAPAHGLEYDDTVYPISDKYPVLRERYDASTYKGKHAFENDNRPPRIIFGMKVRTFLVVAAVMALVIVGAAVGGAVGGQSLRDGSSADGLSMSTSNATVSSTSTVTSSSATTSTFSAPTPTYTPISDCPASNNTTYTSSYATGSNSSSTGLTFTKFCDVASPPSIVRLAEAFVYSFSDCVELCAGYNVVNDSRNCSVAVYTAQGSRPSNCWVSRTEKATTASDLDADSGTDVALLVDNNGDSS